MDTVHSFRVLKKSCWPSICGKKNCSLLSWWTDVQPAPSVRSLTALKIAWTPIFISYSIPSSQTGERNSATQARWKPAYMEKNPPVSSTVTLCAMDKKAVLKMHTPCSGWSFQKAPVSISWLNGMWTWHLSWYVLTTNHNTKSAVRQALDFSHVKCLAGGIRSRTLYFQRSHCHVILSIIL